MANLDLPYPKRMDIAVPANRLCGECLEEQRVLAEEPPDKSPQG